MTAKIFILNIENIKEVLDRNSISYFEVYADDNIVNKNVLCIAVSQNVTCRIEEYLAHNVILNTSISMIKTSLHNVADVFKIKMHEIHNFDLSYGPLNYLEDITPAAFFFQQ